MLLTFSDGSTLDVEYIGKSIEVDNALNITVITEDYNSVRSIFSNKDILSSITTETGEVYNNYSSLKRINTELNLENQTVMYIEVRYAELDSVVDELKQETDKLKAENKELNDQVSMLTDCVLEMSELVYS